MATGDKVVNVLAIIPPGSSYGQEDWRVGGSTPAENWPVIDFASGADEYVDMLCYLTGYDGGGLTWHLPASASSATTGTYRLGVAVRRVDLDSEDVDTSHSYDFNEADDSPPGTLGQVTDTQITMSSGADMDSWADGELAMVRVYRHGTHANDNMSGDLELWPVIGLET